MFFVTVVLLCIACAAYWMWQLRRKSTEPPVHPGAWPIIGHIPLILGNSSDLWNRFNNIINDIHDSGGVTSANFGPRTVYGVSDPEDCATVANACLEKDGYYNFCKPWLGEGLFTAKCSTRTDVEYKFCIKVQKENPKDPMNRTRSGIIVKGLKLYSTWKNHRKVLNPAFSQVVLDTFIGVFNSQSRKLVSDLKKEIGKGPFDHSTYIRLNALETICLTALGVDFTDSNLNNEYVQTLDLIFDTFMERFTKPWWHSRHTFAWSNLKKEHDACVKILHKLSNAVLQKRKSEFNGNTCSERSIIPGTKFKAYVDILLEMSAEKGVFSDKQIREHVDTILVAGHDTSANVLMFTIILLGSHPEAQEKVFDEIQEVLGGDRDVEKTDLSKLVYLEAVLKESMRVFTIIPVIARRLGEDVKLKNCTLSAGRTCIIFLFGLHRHPVWGPDAQEFKPERWLEPGKLKDNPNAFAAFSLGKRQCIGKTYALMSMKTTLVHLVRRYKIRADHTKLRLKLDTMLKPSAGHYVSIESR